MVENCVIVGGGVAGLSAANQLADAGLTPLLIEANDYPSHRICGEFLSSECLPILERWEIPFSTPIQQCRLFSGKMKTSFQLPTQAASCSRFIFDSMLQKRAEKNGARILTRTTVSSLTFHEGSKCYELNLSNGEEIKARHLILGTGRIPKMNEEKKSFLPKYVGFKAHFEGMGNSHSIDMYFMNGGYLGVSPIDVNTTNIACIMRRECVADLNQIHTLISGLLEQKTMHSLRERLAHARMLFPNWLTGVIPEFGIRDNPSWDRVFWIGDAAGSIPPISGDGLAIAITSGCMAADYFLNSDAKTFQQAWLNRYQKRFLWATRLHTFMLSRWMSTIGIGTSKIFPFINSTLWKLTREVHEEG